MQDKITIADAPDCLNTNDKAMWVLGYQAALAARSTCLHQIQVPSAAEQAAWHAGLDEGRAQAAQPSSVSNAETPQAAPAAVAWSMPEEPTEQMIEVLMAGEDRLRARHGDDLPKQRAKDRYRALLSLAATPAAASPAGWKLVPIEPTAEMLGSAGATDRDGTPATYKTLYMAMVGASPAAAPVVLPEPDAVLRVVVDGDTPSVISFNTLTNGEYGVFYASTVRALLATATGLPAQATEEMVHAVAFELIGVTPETPLAEASVKPYLKQAKKLLEIAFNAAPQAQADARDAGRYRDLRTLLYGQDVVIDEATLIFKVTGQCPTTEEFDAGVDSAIAAAKEGRTA